MTTQNENCIFHQAWWMNAVAPKRWKEIEVSKSGVSARLQFESEKKYGLRFIKVPPLTHSVGLNFNLNNNNYSKNLSLQKKLIDEIIERLPPYDYLSLNFHPSITNWLPFYWHGFQQTTRYTYVIERINDTEKLWSNIQNNIKTDIRKATTRYGLRVNSDYSIDKFLDINEKTFLRQKKSLPYSRELVRKLDTICKQHGVSKIFFAEDKKGEIHAAIYIVWDSDSAYYLMGGADPDKRTSGATSFLLWEAIKYSSTVTKKFDFEGSMIKNVERYFRAFGAHQIPYFNIWHLKTKRLQLLSIARQVYKLSKFR